MLMKSGINPFDSQEVGIASAISPPSPPPPPSLSIYRQAKPYKTNPEIVAMTNLVTAYQNDDITEFEKILRTNRSVYAYSI